MDSNSTTEVIEYSDITCPFCEHTESERMAMDSCQYYYDCKCCAAVLRPNYGDCCVFCSYGTVKCPPVQMGNTC